MNVQLMRLRKAAGYSNRDDFAKKIGVNKYTYRSWESGAAMMSAEQVWNCAVALGCTPNDILGWYEDHPREDSGERLTSEEREIVGVLPREHAAMETEHSHDCPRCCGRI